MAGFFMVYKLGLLLNFPWRATCGSLVNNRNEICRRDQLVSNLLDLLCAICHIAFCKHSIEIVLHVFPELLVQTSLQLFTVLSMRMLDMC